MAIVETAYIAVFVNKPVEKYLNRVAQRFKLVKKYWFWQLLWWFLRFQLL